jgi:hypothetical protein
MSNDLSQLPVAAALNVADLLHVRQGDDIDRSLTLSALSAWLQTQMAPDLTAGPLYVDSVSGSDAANGLSTASPKQSLAGAIAAVPPFAEATIHLAANQTHDLSQIVNLDGQKLLITSWNGADHRSDTVLRQIATDGANVTVGGLYLNNDTQVNFSLISLRSASVQGLSGAVVQNSGIINIWYGGDGSCNLSSANVQIVDTEFMYGSANIKTASIGLSLVTLTLSPSGAISGNVKSKLINTKSAFCLSAQSVTLPAGATWKSLINVLSYGADMGPRNVVHNLGNALDFNQS